MVVGELATATVSNTSVNDTWNDVVEVVLSALVEVMVTSYGLSSSPVPNQLQASSSCGVSVPLVALSVVPARAEKTPVLVAAAFSAAPTEAWLAARTA